MLTPSGEQAVLPAGSDWLQMWSEGGLSHGHCCATLACRSQHEKEGLLQSSCAGMAGRGTLGLAASKAVFAMFTEKEAVGEVADGTGQG